MAEQAKHGLIHEEDDEEEEEEEEGVLHSSESLILVTRERQRLKVSENEVPTRIFLPKRNEIAGEMSSVTKHLIIFLFFNLILLFVSFKQER
jgi:tetrahydromethanopterin S-methyltransferase subunit A